MTVHNTLKPGLREKTHERALVHELGKRGIKTDQQKQFEVIYDGKVIDTMVPDLIVADSIIVDTKCATGFDDTHTAQIIGYLSITNLRLGLLINFKHPGFSGNALSSASCPSVPSVAKLTFL